MKTLKQYINIILEGGQSGHMAHIIDYDDFTRDDLIELVSNLFDGKIEDVTEKIDGTNIQATMNLAGEVVFIRNKTDLNSVRGGMSISDMAEKWASKPQVAQTFVTAGETITKVFEKIGKEWFNPTPTIRRIVNCECVIAGKTNIIPYASDQVDFHDIWIYEKGIAEWVKKEVTKDGLKDIENACDSIDNAQLTPKILIQVTKDSEKLKNQYIKDINKLFGKNLSIREWKYDRYFELIKNEYPWLLAGRHDDVYARWFDGNKQLNLRELKKIYKDNLDEFVELDKKGYKDIVGKVIEPLDILFLKLSNDIIRLCKGLLNDGSKESSILQLKKDMEDIKKAVENEGSEEMKSKLTHQLNRLMQLGGDDSINHAEGIVFNYKGRTMKMTGSFAGLNQIIGLRFQLE
jgi:hypothetical protein